MNSRHDSTGAGRAARGAFTLIEIIVVISIIAILTTIGLLVAHHVRQHSQEAFTKDLIKTLDTAYSGLVQDKGGSNVSPIWRDDNGNEFAAIDGTVDMPNQGAAVESSLGIFVLATGQDAGLKNAILRTDSKYVNTSPLVSYQLGMQANIAAPSVPILKDPWGMPIRFVHPRFSGGYGAYNGTARTNYQAKFKRAGNGSTSVEFTRTIQPGTTAAPVSATAADEGICSGSLGYFYSSGWDMDAGTRDNNVYTTVPKFPTETAKLSPPPTGA